MTATLNSEWVPCSTMMPKEGRTVLVWVRHMESVFAAYWTGHIWKCARRNESMHHDPISHWMPVPEGPKDV